MKAEDKQRVLAEVTQRVGFDPRGDLLAATGTDWVFLVFSSGGGESSSVSLHFALIVSVRDRSALLDCLAALRRLLRREEGVPGPTTRPAQPPALVLKQFKLGEQVVDYILVRDRPALSPSVAVTSRYLVMTSTTAAMRQVLAGLGRRELSVASASSFTGLIERVDGGAPVVAVLSLPLLFRLLGADPPAASPPSGGRPAANAGEGAGRFACVITARPGPGGLVLRSSGPVCLTVAAGAEVVFRFLAPAPRKGPVTTSTRPVHRSATRRKVITASR